MDQSDDGITRRKPGVERRREIALIAAELFARDGFSVSTRAIARALGITQAALYRHFDSKDALVEEVFRQRYLSERRSNFRQILEAGGAPLAERLARAYTEFFSDITETSLKLFHRASYDGLEIARRYSPHLDERILLPVLTQLRLEVGLPEHMDTPATRQERELVLMLHSCVVFLAIRKFVYHIDFNGAEPSIIQMYVDNWLTGAIATLRALKPPDQSTELRT